MDGTVLVADDDRTIRTVLTQALTRAGCKVHATASMVTLLRWVDEGLGDLVVTDVVMPDGNGLESLPRIARARPGLPVIVISAQNTMTTAIRAAEAQAWDYLPKPFDLPDLMKRVARALKAPRADAAPLPPPDGADLPLVGRTPAMQAIYRSVARLVNADLPILIAGESGTGKSLLARAIHDYSDRRAQPFVVAGAGDAARPDGIAGLLNRAGNGTLLLDEVGDLDPAAQGLAVRALDTLTDAGPRILATSQSDLAAAMDDGAFRPDLFYRLGGAGIALPPLRDRADDIPLLAEHFLAKAARDGGARRRLDRGALDALQGYSWPGNVRQLETVIARLTVAATDGEAGRDEVEAVLANQPARDRPSGGTDKLSAAVAHHLQRHFDQHRGMLPAPGLYQRILREVETPLIEIAMDATGGNQAKCAELLGINRNTLRKKIAELDIRVTRRRRLM
ncbi:two component, sigma54 specific, transcriptional regulator, Fis family protein [Oceaniovalibus guishaninsula JLT2003]|uniref:DNA-binding transcriptional regulator NtrC n=1 Tax=Oceaniovalibus guishaninsula JLT2003 TaxID=1231392 RepID=K2HAC1_9RHOB|nr:response regulator [Oceaniovalibus guishaninsula]EKE43582.1 two component, sigma54 specific, transcriptional regulator, Fis family protein [Oceaniovalibus guishaninsula JLT2003]